MNGSMPKQILNQVSEHSIGGFILFYFNSENGYPEHVTSLETPVHSLALQKYINDWSDGVKELSIESVKKSIQEFVDEDSEDETKDEDERKDDDENS